MIRQFTKIFSSEKEFSGVAAITLEDGDVLICTNGMRNREEALPVRENTAFGIASGTKGFTALLILKLIEEGLLNLEDHVFDLMPQPFPNMDRRVTIRHLLSHTSGIYDYFDEDILDDFTTMFDKVPLHRIHGPSDMYPLLIEGEAYFNPGEKFRYCNSGFVILGILAEVITKKSYGEAIDDYIVKPLGLCHTGCYRSNRLPGNTALGYEKEEDEQWRSNLLDIPMTCTGDGGLYTCVDDMVRVWEALMQGEIINKELLEEALTVQVVIKGKACYGLGFYINLNEAGDPETYSLIGEDPGVSFLSRYYIKEKRCLAFMSNTSFGVWQMNDAMKVILP